MLTTIVTIVVMILGLCFSISLHELGHMLPAKLFKVPVDQYMIGFGPTLWSKTVGETEYGIKPILFGGYTKIVGMFPAAPVGRVDKKGFWGDIVKDAREESVKGIKEGQEPRAFYNLSSWKKIVCMAGGIFTNLILGCLFFTIALCVVGGQAPINTVGAVQECIQGEVNSSSCVPSPAKAAGLQPGDVIVKIGSKNIESAADVQEAIRDSGGKSTRIIVERGDGTDRSFNIKADAVDEAGNLVEDSKKASGYLIGISFGTQKETLPFSTALDATWAQTTGTMELIPKIPLQMYKSVKSIFTHEPRGNGSMISVVGIGQIAVDQTTSTDDLSQQVGSVLMLLASLNIALFVMNLIPLLPLDGGHILNALYEGVKRTVYKIRGKERPAPADLARSMPIGVVVWGLLILMFVVTVVVDIVNPVKI